MARPSYHLVWSPTSRREMAGIWTYLALHASQEVADAQVQQIRTRTLTLTENPRLGRPRDDLRRGLRQILAKPYIVLYRFDETTVEIMRVVHGSRDLPALFVDEI
jgi:toxin ParE1/3/4